MATTQEILAGRDILVYTEPFLAANTFPADAVWGTAPGGAWVENGYTKDGVVIRWRQQIQEYMIDQFIDPVVVLPLSRDLRFIAHLGQVNMPALTVSTGQGTASGVTGGASGTAGYTIAANAANAYYSIFFDVKNPVNNDFAHFVGWKTRGIGDIEIAIHLSDIASLNMEMRALPDDSVTPARIGQFRMQFG